MNASAPARVHSSLGGASGTSGSKFQSSRDELVAKRYNLTEPQGVFPLDGISSSQQTSTGPQPSHSLQSQLQLQQQHHQHQQQQQQQNSPKFPDFQPWKHTPKEDEIAVSHLQKGFLENPYVGNELLSARNIMHQLLRSKNSLDELSVNLLKAINVRSANNTIGQSLFKPPPRVTLTDQKREAWLRDLASSSVPLRKLSRTIPHGVRNKVLLEQCIAKNIPMNRAIWFVRCISTNELRGLKRKGGSNIELNWVQEWTTQLVEYIEKLSLDYLKFETFQQATESWKFNISYILRFSSNLYIENLIDHDSFKNWINNFFKTCKNFELPLALTIVKIFWDELIKTDYLIKELTESFVLRYQKVQALENMLDSKEEKFTDVKLNEKIKAKLLNDIKELIMELFNYSVDNFILPNNWDQIGLILKSILNLEDSTIASKFELISYRNQSLMINYSLNKDIVVNDLVNVLDGLKESIDYKSLVDLIFNESTWKENLETLFYWSITKYRTENHRVYIVAEILKKLKTNQIISMKEIEQELMDTVFKLHNQSETVDFDSLFLLLNELSLIKAFKFSIYIRRLISSGLVYLTTNQDEKLLHSSILRNLRPHKSSQATMMLKNLDGTRDLITQEDKINKGLQLLNSVSIDDMECYQFLDTLEVGVKLNIAESFLKSLLSEVNLFPLLTYKEFERILKSFIILNDHRHMLEFIIKALESNELDLDQIELIIEFSITNVTLISALNQFENILELTLSNVQTPSNRGISLTKLKALVNRLEVSDALKDQLVFLADNKSAGVEQSRVNELVSTSSLNLSMDDFTRPENFHNTFQILIKSIFNDSNEQHKRKLIVDLLLVLRQSNPTELSKILFVYVKKTYSNSSDLFKFEPLLDLLISELISLEVIVQTFLSFNLSIYTSFVLDLLFKEFTQPESLDYYKLSLLREQFKAENPKVVLNLIQTSLIDSDPKVETNSIQSESSDLINSLLPDNSLYRSDFSSIFQDNLIHSPNLLVETLIPLSQIPSQKTKLITLLNETLLIDESNVKTNIDPSAVLLQNLKKLNRFNLPIFQLLFKLNFDSNNSDEIIVQVIEAVFENVGDNHQLFGGLFKLLDYELKLKFIHRLESLFLNSKSFPNVVINDHSVKLNTISEILTTLSRGSKNFGLREELIFSLDVTLDTLLKIVSQTETPSQLLFDSIFLFLKIIIIHKPFLIGIIAERNSIKESFLNNIVSLLTTNVVSHNLQLKNLLYDLILSIKSNVNELNSTQTNIIKLPLSIVNLPAISSTVQTKTEHHHTHHQNLNDFNVTNNLFLYQKNSMGYHDLNLKPFDLLEEANPVENINDTAISLQLFEASLERKNPVR